MLDYGFCFEVGILIAPKEAWEKKFAHSLFISFFEVFANAGSMSGASHGVYVLLIFPNCLLIFNRKEE
jgi:hypothetical protein